MLLEPEEKNPAVYFIATKHDSFKHYRFPKGSVVLDPFGHIAGRPGVDVIHIGRQN